MIVAVVDTGIEIKNKHIAHSVFVNKNEIPENGIDDDNNGYVDDINGWNFYDNNNQLYSDLLSDYHGTVIAGIISGNHKYDQCKGIAPQVSILPVKCFAGSTGEISDTVKGIEYAINMGATIINLSWDTEIENEDLYNIINDNENILFICSAGKNMKDVSEIDIYPSAFKLDNLVSVAAINSKAELFYLSNYGSEVTLAAPGVSIHSILPEEGYIFTEGTSMAVAHVTGVAALLKSYHNNLSPTEIIRILKEGSVKSDELFGKVSTGGYISIENSFKVLLDEYY